jgi:hypothetical protein
MSTNRKPRHRRPSDNAPYDCRDVGGRRDDAGLDPRDVLPDARDGLTRIERIVLHTLHEAQRERGDRNVPTAMLYGRVVEKIDISVAELQRVLQRLIGVR